MNRAKETNLTGDVQASIARVVDAAVPGGQIKPNRSQIVAVAVLLALLLGALASILIDKLDNTVKGGEDAELRLKQPLLAAFPQVEALDQAHMARLYLDDPHSHFAEAVRTARTGVMLSSLDAPHKVLLITSSLPGEGKTTVSVNMALAHAQTKRTVLVDCDMRRSQVSRALNIGPGKLGLSNLVAGTATFEQCLHEVEGSTLLVLPVGDLPPNPLELMLSQRFKDTLATLKEHFEMVIIDSPPVELVSEALVLAPLATSTAFVVKAMSTPAPLVRKNLARLQRAGANILGVVVNQLDFKHARLYYGEYGAASYSYGGYGDTAKLTYGAPKPSKKPKAA
jgi:capsular exopolysaccharide synthesis family protein